MNIEELALLWFRIMAINAKQPEEFQRMNSPLRSILFVHFIHHVL
jgi:hypothetical protein